MPDEITTYVSRYAPSSTLKRSGSSWPRIPKPDDQPGTHVQWATRILREQGEGEFGDGLPVDQVAREIRRRDS